MADTMWPLTLDMTRDECRGLLRQSELETYSSVVGTFRAQGALDETKARILRELRGILHITDDRHKAEARRVANDERLCTVAEMLAGPNTGQEWSREGHRNYPLLHRGVAHTALLPMANEAQACAQRANYLLPLPEHTHRDPATTLDQALPIDPRTPVVIGDQHEPPRPPKAPPTGQKPLLKRTLTGEELHRRRIADLVAPLHHTNMRIQELYHQHANTPQPQQAAAEPGLQMPAIFSNAQTISGNNSFSVLSQIPQIVGMPAPGNSVPLPHPLPPPPQSTRKSGGTSTATKRGPKTTKPARAPKTPRTPAATTAAASRAAATGNQRAPKSSAKQHPQAALQAELAYGSSLKSRKLNYPQDKHSQSPQHAALLGETFPTDRSNAAANNTTTTTFLWPPPASHDQQQQHHFTVTDSMLQTFAAPLTLSTTTAAAAASPLPAQQQQALLTQNSPVQVVFTSSTVEMLPVGGDAQRSLPNNFITESTPITWVTDDVLPQTVQTAPPTSTIIVPLQSPVLTQQQPQQPLPPPHASPVLLQTLQPPSSQATFVQHQPILQPLLVAAAASNASAILPAVPTNTAGRPPGKMVMHTPRKTAQALNSSSIAAATKAPKMSRKKAAAHVADAAVVLQAPTSMKPPPPQNSSVPPPLHPPLPTNLQQLLDTSLQIHSITSKQQQQPSASVGVTSVAGATTTVSPHPPPKIVHTTPAKSAVPHLLHSKSMNIVQKINVHPQLNQNASSTATTKTATAVAPVSVSASPSTSANTSKSKVQITHQEIIVPPNKSSMSSSAGGSMSANIVSQLKTMQSKGNVKLVQSANGSIMLKAGTNSEVVIPVGTSAARIAGPLTVTTATAGIAATAATSTPIKPATSYPKIQLVKTRNSIAGGGNMVLMQKLPPGKFTAGGSSGSGTVAITTSTGMTPAKDQPPTTIVHRQTVKLVPFKPMQQSTSSTPKMLIMSGGSQMPLKAVVPFATAATAAALTVPIAAAAATTAAPVVKITEDTPVDILSAESVVVIDVPPPPATSSASVAHPIVLESMSTVRPTVSAMQSTPKHKLVMTTTSAARAQTSASGSPTKRLRIDEKKVVRLTTSTAAPVTAAPSTSTVANSVPSSTSALQLANSTDWEKELDEQTRRKVPPQLANNAPAATTQMMDEQIEDDDEAIIVGEYMATEDDIIQYDGDDYQEMNAEARRSAKSEAVVVGGAASTAANTGGTNGSAVTVVSTAAAAAASAAASASTTTTTTTAPSDAGDREEGEASETIVMQMEEVDEHGQSHMRNVSLEELVDSGHILMDDS